MNKKKTSEMERRGKGSEKRKNTLPPIPELGHLLSGERIDHHAVKKVLFSLWAKDYPEPVKEENGYHNEKAQDVDLIFCKPLRVGGYSFTYEGPRRSIPVVRIYNREGDELAVVGLSHGKEFKMDLMDTRKRVTILSSASSDFHLDVTIEVKDIPREATGELTEPEKLLCTAAFHERLKALTGVMEEVVDGGSHPLIIELAKDPFSEGNQLFFSACNLLYQNARGPHRKKAYSTDSGEYSYSPRQAEDAFQLVFAVLRATEEIPKRHD